MLPRLKHSLMLSLLIATLSFSYVHASEQPDQESGWLSDLPTIFRAGSGFACSVAASAAFVASAYILAQSYKSHISEQDTLKQKTYLPPGEFFWSMATGTAFIAALFALTETAWSKQT